MRRVELTDEDIGALVNYLDIAVKQVGIQSVKNVFILLGKLESAPIVEDEFGAEPESEPETPKTPKKSK